MSDLRDRIARVLHARFGPSLGAAEGGWDDEPAATKDVYREDADAVIAKLGLHPAETLDRRYVRWVTKWRNNPEWKANDE